MSTPSPLTTFRNTVQDVGDSVPSNFGFPIAASVTCHQGGLVELSAAGLAQPAGTAGTQQPVVGVCTDPEGADISSGASSLIVNVIQGVFDLDQGTGADAITQKNVGAIVYCIDDHTVGLTSANGTRPVAGKLVGINANGDPLVEVGFVQGFKNVLDLELVATAVVTAGTLVQIDSSHPGQVITVSAAGLPALGVAQNTTTGTLGHVTVRVAGVSLVSTAGSQTVGDLLAASTSTGTTKTAVVLTTAGTVVTAGSAVVGIALTSCTGAGTIQALITPGGGVSQSAYT